MITSKGNSDCTECLSGQASDVVARKTACPPCDSGKYSKESGMTACLKCVPGKFQNLTGQQECIQCSEGTFSLTKVVTCTACPIGYTAESIGQASCQRCEAGKAGNGCQICQKGRYRGNKHNVSNCLLCPAGFYTNQDAQPFCLLCDVGKFSNKKSSSNCTECGVRTYQPERGKDTCLNCPVGYYNEQKSQPLCLQCDIGKYSNLEGNQECHPCSASTYQDERGERECKPCDPGYYTNKTGQASCVECDPGKFNKKTGQSRCEDCTAGKYQPEKKQIECINCLPGKVAPSVGQATCQFPDWTLLEDCVPQKEYFNSTDPNYKMWKCIECPYGANCVKKNLLRALHWYNVTAKAGFWRVPWSTSSWTNLSVDFFKCPYPKDCIGWTASNPEAKESCLTGTRGPLCSLCQKGYTRDTVRCSKCSNESFGIRVGILVVCIVFFVVCVNECRKRQKRENFQKWKKLYLAYLQIASINVTYAQINLSMPSIIEIDWPIEWVNWIKRFSFVNIDISQILGVTCIGGEYLYAILNCLYPVYCYQYQKIQL